MARRRKRAALSAEQQQLLRCCLVFLRTEIKRRHFAAKAIDAHVLMSDGTIESILADYENYSSASAIRERLPWALCDEWAVFLWRLFGAVDDSEHRRLPSGPEADGGQHEEIVRQIFQPATQDSTVEGETVETTNAEPGTGHVVSDLAAAGVLQDDDGTTADDVLNQEW